MFYYEIMLCHAVQQTCLLLCWMRVLFFEFVCVLIILKEINIVIDLAVPFIALLARVMDYKVVDGPIC